MNASILPPDTLAMHVASRISTCLALAIAVTTSPSTSTAYAQGVSLHTARASAAATLEATVDAAVERTREAPVEAISIAIMRGDEVLLAKGYGRANIARNILATPQTIFEIGSMTKQFTAAGIMRLVERGMLSLEDPVARYLPALASRAEHVTLRHLLSHTSGLSRAWVVADLSEPSLPQVVLDSLSVRAVEFAPGERYAYNNNGYILLGLIIEHLVRTSYVDFVAAEFITPLGLTSTMPCSDAPPERLAVGYEHDTRGDASPSIAVPHHTSVTFAAGMFCSTAGDLSRWQRALASGRALAPESWRQMSTSFTLASGRPSRYGLGVETHRFEDQPYLAHTGATPGFLGEMGYLADSAISVTVMTNGVYAGSIVSLLAQGVLRAVLNMPARLVVDRPMSAEQRAPFVGTYTVGPLEIDVYEHGTHLRAQPQGQVPSRLLHEGGGVFRSEHDPSLTLRFDIVDGEATQLHLKQGDRALPSAQRRKH